MTTKLKVKWEDQSARDFIPTLLDVKPDGLYVSAFCPLCDREEKSKMEPAGQSRAQAASVDRIQAHIRARHPKAALRDD